MLRRRGGACISGMQARFLNQKTRQSSKSYLQLPLRMHCSMQCLMSSAVSGDSQARMPSADASPSDMAPRTETASSQWPVSSSCLTSGSNSSLTFSLSYMPAHSLG